MLVIWKHILRYILHFISGVLQIGKGTYPHFILAEWKDEDPHTVKAFSISTASANQFGFGIWQFKDSISISFILIMFIAFLNKLYFYNNMLIIYVKYCAWSLWMKVHV